MSDTTKLPADSRYGEATRLGIPAIDLRSDTQTKPSAAMREAMAHAEVGDEQQGEDPTVLALEQRAATYLGQEAAVYVPSATMANQIALVILGAPATELLLEETAHILCAELGGAAAHAGLQTRGVPGVRGVISPEQLRASAVRNGGNYTPRTSVLALENTHNSSGGTVWPLEDLRSVVAVARELEIGVHLDGARLANASVASGVPASVIGGLFDTVTLCLSKGLGAPVGAVIAGSAELMERARFQKHRFGGAMRQAGIVAAAGVYALEHNVDRLADDHARAKRLAEGLAARGVSVAPDPIETNFVLVDVTDTGLTMAEAIARIAAVGVGMGGSFDPGVLRALTHLDISDADIDRVIEVVPEALGIAVSS